ncbi:MAG: ribonuclease HII [Bacillota bacterium]|nr:ribonuclease HII [Bacillota bacterium]
MSGRAEAQLARWQQMCGYERELWARGVYLIAGLDEAGRGPLAGPVTAAAVILPPDCRILGVDDSKKLSPARRAALEPLIKETAVAWAVADVNHRLIDRINILEASRLAMLRALAKLALRPEHLLIDALSLDTPLPQTAIVKGDANSVSIAAASILAKNHRDRLMEKLDALFPEYGLAQHKGYPTAAHRAACRKYGLSAIHRRSFCRNIMEDI